MVDVVTTAKIPFVQEHLIPDLTNIVFQYLTLPDHIYLNAEVLIPIVLNGSEVLTTGLIRAIDNDKCKITYFPSYAPIVRNCRDKAIRPKYKLYTKECTKIETAPQFSEVSKGIYYRYLL